MRTLGLVAEKVAHFLAVLFLSSFVLACFLWVSPGSPGKPRDPVNFETAKPGKAQVCVDAENCGTLISVKVGSPTIVTVDVDGADLTCYGSEAKLPGPGFVDWFFGEFWVGVFKWDVGQTKKFEPALDVVLEGAKYTVPLVFGTLAVAVLLSLFGVAFLLWLPFPSLRGLLRTLLLVVSITPVFILGYIIQGQGILNPGWLTAPVVIACVAILCIGDSNLGEMLLQFENEVRRLYTQDYIHAANLRGASLFKHMLPGLLMPISSISAAKVAFLLGSVVIAESLFGVAGLGDASLQAAEGGDSLLLLSITVFITFLVALVALVRDLLEILIDPRMRRSAEDGG